MNDNIEEEGISLIDLFKVMFGRKLVILISLVSTIIIGTLLIIFVYNNSVQTYSAQFTYSDPVLVGGKYVDGSIFNYQSLITESNLNNVKEANNQFKSINIDNILENDGISITAETVKSQYDETKIISQQYTIVAKKKYFKTQKQAKNFFKAIANSAKEKNGSIAEKITYVANLDAYDNVLGYDAKASYLVAQLELLDEGYETLIENYGDLLVESTGLTVSATKASMDTFFADNSVNVLDYQIRSNIYFANDAKTIEYYENQYTYYNGKYSSNLAKIDELQNKVDILLDKATGIQSVEIAAYNELICEYTLENVDLIKNIRFISNVLGKYDTTDPNYIEPATATESLIFKTKMDELKKSVESFTTVYTDTIKGVVADANQVYFNNSSIVRVSGGINQILAVVFTTIMGLVIGCAINLCLDGKKLSRNYVEPKKEEETENIETKDEE